MPAGSHGASSAECNRARQGEGQGETEHDAPARARAPRGALPCQCPVRPLEDHDHDLLHPAGRHHRLHNHQGATDTDVFRTYVAEVLCPTLRPGDLVIMDNLAPHKSEPTLALIAAADAQAVFLPAYSPDFNPH